MGRRFTALRAVGTMFKVLAWITVVLGLLLAALAVVLGLTVGIPLGALQLQRGGELIGIAASLLILIAAVLFFLLLYATGELVYAFLSVEENTRRTAYLLQQQYLAAQTAGSTPPDYEAYPESDEPPA
jgi:hypothetical protein